MKYPQLVSMPSAVSDWLEEQLELRGIDSALYSRYILSLLHAHTVEVIHPEDDLTFSGLKPNGGKQKHVRRAGSRWWRRHADANAERIKRSAAVECLMSAVEQNCEVESLIDELCEKLKQINSESSSVSSPNNLTREKTIRKPFEQRNVNPKEQAEKYFQAFPPLNQKQECSYFSNINLVAGKWPSSNKDHFDLITTKWSADSPKKFIKRKPKRQFQDIMKPICKSNHPRHNKTGFKRNHFGKNLSREMADNIANWEFVYNNNNNYKNQDQCLDFNQFPEDIDMNERYENDSPICRMKLWLKNADSEKDFKTIQNNAIKRGGTLAKKSAEYISLYPTSIWSDDEKFANNEWASNNNKNLMDITDGKKPTWPNNNSDQEKEEEEEESAIRQEYQHQLKQAKLETESAIKEEYSRLIGSQSGKFDINCNETIEGTFTSNVNMLSPYQIENDIYNFGLVAAADEFEKQDDHFTTLENNTNNVLESLQTMPAIESAPVNQVWWDDAPKIPLGVDLIDEKTISLIMVNHSKEMSAFCEYSRPCLSPNSFSSDTYQPLKLSSLQVIPAGSEQVSDKKRASATMYFEPIKPVPKQIVKESGGQKLEDGTTFNIRGSPDKVKFSKTPAGSLLLQSDSGELKRYLEYNCKTPNDESLKLPIESCSSKSNKQFSIKYSVCPNDKSCQTIENAYLLPEHEESFDLNAEPIFDDSNLMSEDFEIKESFLADFEPDNDLHMEEQDEPYRADSLCESDEVVWGYAPKSSDVFCKYCNVKHPWPDNNPLKKLRVDLDERTLKDIWGGTETCTVCPWSTKVPTPLIETTTQLREESKEEAERLLSDLSSLQLSYSARLLKLDAPFSVQVEDGPREKKRRHSYMDSDINVWSFATRLQEDCYINLSTLPARRSVTL